MRFASRAANGVCRGLAALVAALGCHALATAQDAADSHSVESPDGRLQVVFRLDERGRPLCDLSYRHAPIASVEFGLKFLEGGPVQENLRVIEIRAASHDETYAVPVGKASRARDRHEELVVSLEETAPPGRRFDVVIRAFDDGVAFRYVLKKAGEQVDFALVEELTRFEFPADATAHYLPLAGFTTSYEGFYETRAASEIKHDQLIALPMLLQLRGGDLPAWVAITEANLHDYAGMYLSPVADSPGAFGARLSPLPGRDDGAAVLAAAPHASPWRVLMIGDDPGRLLESQLVRHLNDPSRIADPSWIKTGKTMFPWWNGYVLEGVDFKPGLNTATYKHYVDFCAEHGIEFHSFDGADTAWYGGPIVPDGPTNITQAVPEIDLPEVLAYARQKGVGIRLWMHWQALKPQIDEAFPLYEKWGVHGVMVDFMDRDDQEMVAFYHEVAEKAARHKLTVTWHGCYKPTGMERTWPNVLSYEAALNQEYDKWNEGGISTKHNLDIALVRMLAGPVDYHQGGMRNVAPADFQPRNDAPLVLGTRVHQLATYVVLENHLPMVADYPAAYRGQPGLDFLASVPTNWDETRVLAAEFGKCVAIARRQGDAWYVGAMTAGEPQELKLPLSFLPTGKFSAELWLDDADRGATALQTRKQVVSAGETLDVTTAADGGFVARLTPLP